MHRYNHTCNHTYMYDHIYIYACRHASMYVRTSVCLSACLYVCRIMYIGRYACVNPYVANPQFPLVHIHILFGRIHVLAGLIPF